MAIVQSVGLSGSTGSPVARGVATKRATAGAARALGVQIDRSLMTGAAAWGLRQLLATADIPFRMDDSGSPEVYYGFDPMIGHRAGVWIAADPAIDYLGAEWCVADGLLLPVMDRERVLGDRHRHIRIDLGALSAFWLRLEGERSTGVRDLHGRVPSGESLPGRLGILERPAVHTYAKWLRQRLALAGLDVPVLDRWPEGKKWAIVVTHDVDEPETRNTAHPCIRQILLGRGRGRREAYWALRKEFRARGISESILSGPGRRREWDFDEYCEVEKAAGMRSAFFFSVVPKGMGHPCDVTYDASLARYRRVMRKLGEGGWEVGLHASYETIEDRPSLLWQAGRLRSVSSQELSGMRHHYLRLDRGDPVCTLRSAADCGIRYDTSMGFNDAPGFRAGTALPFRPFFDGGDPARDFVELPMTLADMHLPARDPAAAIERALAHLEAVREMGGMAVLNWHVGNWHSKPGWRESFEAVCGVIRDDETVWAPAPSQAADWWRYRSGLMGA